MNINKQAIEDALKALKGNLLSNSYILISDQNYLIEHNFKFALNEGNGVLKFISKSSSLTPMEVIGEYSITQKGQWTCSVRGALIGTYEKRDEALAALWINKGIGYGDTR